MVRDIEASEAAVTGRVNYKIETITGNRRGAGTDANVYIEVCVTYNYFYYYFFFFFFLIYFN